MNAIPPMPSTPDPITSLVGPGLNMEYAIPSESVDVPMYLTLSGITSSVKYADFGNPSPPNDSKVSGRCNVVMFVQNMNDVPMLVIPLPNTKTDTLEA